MFARWKLRRRLAGHEEFELRGAEVEKREGRLVVDAALGWPLIPRRVAVLEAVWRKLVEGLNVPTELWIWVNWRRLPTIRGPEAVERDQTSPVVRIHERGVEWCQAGIDHALATLLEYAPPRDLDPLPVTYLVPDLRPWFEACPEAWTRALRERLERTDLERTQAAALVEELELEELRELAEAAVDRPPDALSRLRSRVLGSDE